MWWSRMLSNISNYLTFLAYGKIDSPDSLKLIVANALTNEM